MIQLHMQLGMTIDENKARQFVRDNIWLMALIEYNFILLHAIGKDEWKDRYSIAYELKDLSVRL